MFIHRDLKSSNLLIDENGRVKVCDFGLSQVKQQGEYLKDMDSAKGTPLWMAPVRRRCHFHFWPLFGGCSPIHLLLFANILGSHAIQGI
jgi:serine/threonine protein kinase